MPKTKSKLWIRFGVLISLALFVFIWGLFPDFVLHAYSEGVYPIISKSIRWFSALFPLALGDLLYAIIIIYILKLIIQFFWRIKSKGWQRSDKFNVPISVINTLLIFYISLNLLWGLNYSRPRINETLNISNQPYQKEQLIALHDFLLAQIKATNYNALSATNQNFDISTLTEIATQSLARLSEKNKLFSYKFASVKPTFSGWLTSKMGIEGYYNPLSGEANVNMLMPNHVLPYVVCHEIAHQLGIAKEDEANLVGYLTSLNSDNVQFKYAAYYSMLKYVLFEIRIVYPDDYEKELAKVPATVRMHFNDEQIFWSKYNGAMSAYMSTAFDQLLKLNRQEQGIKSYQEIVLWLVNYHQKELKISESQQSESPKD